jgi:Zn-dependent protease with chaperone function
MFSLDLTRDPVAFISGEKRLCDVNLMDESVKGLRKIFFATHPSTLERVAMGENWKPSGLK